MKTTRPQQLEDAIEYMKSKVQKNQSRIKTILKTIEDVKKDLPFSDSRSNTIDNYRKEHKALFEENQELIKIQNTIISYLTNFNIVEQEKKEMNQKSETNKKLSKDEIFELTINGKMEVNKRHPFNNDLEMLNKLLDHFILKEEYEVCSTISELIQQYKSTSPIWTDNNQDNTEKSFFNRLN